MTAAVVSCASTWGAVLAALNDGQEECIAVPINRPSAKAVPVTGNRLPRWDDANVDNDGCRMATESLPERIYIGLYSEIRKKSKRNAPTSAVGAAKSLRNPRSNHLFPNRRNGSAQGRRGRLAPWTLQPVGAPARRAGRRLQRARVPPPALAAVFRRGASALWKCLGDRLASPLTWRSPARTARRNLFA